MELPPKLWFRLQRLKKSLRSAFGSKDEVSFETAHRMCPNCRGLIDRSASVCPLCGVSLRSARARSGTGSGRVLGLIPVPSTASSAVIAITIALYGITWYMTQSAAAATLSPAPSLGGISGSTLVRFGAKFGPAIVFGHQWWRLVTAIFLHGGLLHIGFNLWCLFDLGPIVESLFSTTKFILIYLVTGVAGFLLSFWLRTLSMVPSVGASGAILGLIGILIAASFHHGSLGKAYRSQLWRWVIYIFVFSLLPGVDLAAHVGGFVSGMALGYIIPEGEPASRSEENLWNALAVLSVLVIAGSFALMALHLGQAVR
jgi:rhomboid protease GluP